MRLLFDRRVIALWDQGISAPSAGAPGQGYELDATHRVLLWANLIRVLRNRTVILSAKLRITIVGRNGVPGSLSIARLLKPAQVRAATWEGPLPGVPFQVPGGQEGSDFTLWRTVSFVPTSSEHRLELDVTEDLRAWVTHGEPNNGWILGGSARIGGARAARIGTAPAIDVSYSGMRTNGAAALAGVYDALGG